MKLIQITNVVIAICITLLFMSCSSSNSPVEPAGNLPGISSEMQQDIGSQVDSDRAFIGIFQAEIDQDAGTFTIEPVDRSSEYHFPLTNMFPDVLSITGFGWTPTFWADIKISHPYPSSGIDGFDPRVIAILPANPGVSMNYPTMWVQANNSVVLHPDGYTKLFDVLPVAGNANPFISYFKDQPYRIWSSFGYTQQTKRWEMDISGFGGSLQYYLVVDVSTKYPNPSLPRDANTPEPVEIDVLVGFGLESSGGSANVDVILHDWQGSAGIGQVKVEAPDLFAGTVDLTYTADGPGLDEYIFSGTISNSYGASVGEHNFLVGAEDAASGVWIYDEFSLEIYDQPPFDLTDVTPDWLNFTAKKVFNDGKYLYVGGGNNSLHVFVVHDPDNPVWLTSLETEGIPRDIFVKDGYAYVVNGYFGLDIFDVDPIQSAHLVKHVGKTVNSSHIYVENGHAFVGAFDDGLQIFDIDPPETASWVAEYPAADARGIAVEGDYAYLCDNLDDLVILHVNPPDSPNFVKSIPIPGGCEEIAVTTDHAFITARTDGIHVVNINPPGLATLVDSVVTHSDARGIYVNGDYAYVADWSGGVEIIDISTIGSCYIWHAVETPGLTLDVTGTDQYAYIADTDQVHIVDLNVHPYPEIISTMDTTCENPKDVEINGDYAYIAHFNKGLQIVDISTPDSATVIKSIETGDQAYAVAVEGGIAYVADDEAGLRIIDIDPPETASVIGGVDTPGHVYDVAYDGKYAYITDTSEGLYIVDVDPPEAANIVKFVNLSGFIRNVVVSGDYAYCLDMYDYFYIVDINPPQTAHIVNSYDTGFANWGFDVANGYAFIACEFSGMIVLDIFPPDSISNVKTYDIGKRFENIHVSGRYVYASMETSGFGIFDVNDPTNPLQYWQYETDGIVTDVDVSGNHACVVDGSKGLKIIQLY